MRNKEKKLNHERVLKLFNYNPNTGEITRRVSRGPKKAGSIVGYKRNDGYIAVEINSCAYLIHRLIWFMITQQWPSLIDHVDGDPTNNKWDNLRLCNSQENSFNRGMFNTNTSGVKGVHWHKQAGKWQVGLRLDGRYKSLGLYKDLELAELAIREAREKYHKEFLRHE